MKVEATSGRSGFLVAKEAPLNNQSASYDGGFCLIDAKGATSYFDTVVDESIEGGKALEVGCPVKLEAWASQDNCPLKEGDTVTPWDMRISCWTTNHPHGLSEGTVDVTSQCDIIKGQRDIRGDGNITGSGTVNGYLETDSEMQDFIKEHFSETIRHNGKDTSTKITLVPRKKDSTFWTFFTTRETTVVGEVEETIIQKVKIDSFNMDQPDSGFIPFNYSYTTLATYNYRKEVS